VARWNPISTVGPKGRATLQPWRASSVNEIVFPASSYLNAAKVGSDDHVDDKWWRAFHLVQVLVICACSDRFQGVDSLLLDRDFVYSRLIWAEADLVADNAS